MSGANFAAPGCSIEVYPFENPPYALSPGMIRSVTVSNSLRGGGSFDIQLAPGGPFGAESPRTWAEIITPMSHVLIGMSRGLEAAVVMDGVATHTTAAQEWRTNQQGVSSAARGQSVAGNDFGYFFRSFNYYALTFYGLVAGTPVGGALNFVPGSLASKLSSGLIGGNSSSESNPRQVGKAWYDNVMAGSSGILGNTFVPYVQGSRVRFSDVMSTVWEDYPDVFIPFSDFFMVGDETWIDKFNGIFPAPWYEVFVTTAPDGAYQPTGKASTQSGKFFGMTSIPNAKPAGPQVIARVNPTPSFNITGTSIGELDMSRWNALPLYDFTQNTFRTFRTSMTFSANAARNFYQLNPTGYSTITNNNANNVPFPFQFIAAADAASVQRYGFRPQIGTTRWFFDPQGNAAKNGTLNVQDTVLHVTGKLISWFHPVPLMAQGDVIIPLAPSVLIGTRFRCIPFKGEETWDFYVEGFEHRFEFGGDSSTRLSLSRGLPTAVYQNPTLLKAIYTGNAMRSEGVYTAGLPAGTELGLQVVTTSAQAADLSSHLATVFVTPQSGAS